MRMEITSVKNGFVVKPETPQSNTISWDEVTVFVTYESLFEYIREQFGPLVELQGEENGHTDPDKVKT